MVFASKRGLSPFLRFRHMKWSEEKRSEDKYRSQHEQSRRKNENKLDLLHMKFSRKEVLNWKKNWSQFISSFRSHVRQRCFWDGIRPQCKPFRTEKEIRSWTVLQNQNCAKPTTFNKVIQNLPTNVDKVNLETFWNFYVNQSRSLQSQTKCICGERDIHTTLLTPEKHPLVFCLAQLSPRIVETRTVQQAPIQLEKRDFQKPSPTKPSTSVIRSTKWKLDIPA